MRDDIRSDRAIRLGLNFIKGLSDDDANIIVARRGRGYDSVRDLWLRTGLSPSTIAKIADADGFRSLGLTRRDAGWAVMGLKGSDGAETLPLFVAAGRPGRHEEPNASLPPMPPGEKVIRDYRSLRLSLKAHPVSFLRETLTQKGIVPAAMLRDIPAGRIVTTAGVVLVRQRPGTASGVVFASLEDETGLANIIVWPKVFEQFRRVVLGSRMMGVQRQVQKEGLVVRVIAKELFNMTPILVAISRGYDIGDAVIANADAGKSGPRGSARSSDKARETKADRESMRRALPAGRNFIEPCQPSWFVRCGSSSRATRSSTAVARTTGSVRAPGHLGSRWRSSGWGWSWGWEFHFYAGRETIAGHVYCSICGKRHPTFRLGWKTRPRPTLAHTASVSR